MFLPYPSGMLDLRTNWNTNSWALERAELVPRGTSEVPLHLSAENSVLKYFLQHKSNHYSQDQ